MSAKPLRVCALTSGLNQPSSRFRWRQYITELRSKGIEPTELQTRWGAFPPQSKLMRPAWLMATFFGAANIVRKANSHHLRFLQREMISTLYSTERFLRKPFIFDVDDAIFLSQRFSGIDRIARQASLIVCGNSFLADHFSRFAPTVILPTAVDVNRFIPKRPAISTRTLGWSGSSSGFVYLYQIESALSVVLDRFPDVRLRIIADHPPNFLTIPRSRIDFMFWNPEIEIIGLQDLTVGIMPLANSLWEKGKCSFKMLTYMAVGIPVVVSDVGMNIEVMSHGCAGYLAKTSDDWIDALSVLLNDDEKNFSMGRTGRSVVEDHFATKIIGTQLAALLSQSA